MLFSVNGFTMKLSLQIFLNSVICKTVPFETFYAYSMRRCGLKCIMSTSFQVVHLSSYIFDHLLQAVCILTEMKLKGNQCHEFYTNAVAIATY